MKATVFSPAKSAQARRVPGAFDFAAIGDRGPWRILARSLAVDGLAPA